MEIQGFARIIPTRKTGDEQFAKDKQTLDFNLIDFWRWSASDLVSNATRGILAEYIVARALGLNMAVRAEWDAFDLWLAAPDANPEGIKIEVKSASYIQSWFHQKLSPINFGISPTRLWDAETNILSEELKRQADIYVFCVLGHEKMRPEEKANFDPMDVSQWTFYVLPTSVLDEKVPAQKSINLSSLRRLNPCEAKYERLATCIQNLAQQISDHRTINCA